jgi:hypothetical protein
VDSPSYDVLALQNEANQRWVVQQHHLEAAYQASLTLPKGHGYTLTLPAELETKEQEA